MTKLIRNIFVIMPFREVNGRKHDDLTYFYENHIKKPVEGHEGFLFDYKVRRSESELSMNDGIIDALVSADIVICDVSGPLSNANVMYELGIRFSVSDRPVILIREQVAENQSIFDIHGLFQQPYLQSRIATLEEHLIKKIKAFESGDEAYASPILKSINATSTYWSLVPKRKACAFLGGLALATESALRIFGSQAQTFLIEKDSALMPLPPTEVYKILQTITDEKMLVDFSYSFAKLPALDNYLSSIYLMGLVDEELELKFREFLIAYSINFLASTSSYVQGNKSLLFTAYSAESLLLINLCRSLIQILQSRPGSTEYEAAKVKFLHNADKSNILKV